MIAIFGGETLGLQALLGEPAHHHFDAAMGDEDALGAGRAYGGVQPRPVRVVGHDKPAVDTAPAPRATQLHPAAGKRIGRIGKAPHPAGAAGRGRRDHQCPAQRGLVEQRVAGVMRGRQCHASRAVDGIDGLDRAMRDDGPYRCIDAILQPLRLAQRIGVEHRRAPGLGIGAPPGVDLGKQFGLRGPAVDRQAKRRFGDEGIAAHRLEGRAGAVVFELVVARRHPDPAAMLEPHLGRTEHMAGRVQRQPHAMVLYHLAIGQRLQRDVLAQTPAQNGRAVMVGQVMRAAIARMVAVRMRDHRALHRPPGIDVEIAGRAIEPLGAGNDQVRSISHPQDAMRAPPARL